MIIFFFEIDECQGQKHNCDINARCDNIFGSFNCTCVQGYSGNGVNCSGMTSNSELDGVEYNSRSNPSSYSKSDDYLISNKFLD